MIRSVDVWTGLTGLTGTITIIRRVADPAIITRLTNALKMDKDLRIRRWIS